MSKAKQQANRFRRTEVFKRQQQVSLPRGRLEEAASAKDARTQGQRQRRREGAHYTPMSLAEQVVARAIEPLLLQIANDPEAWDRAHPPPPSYGDGWIGPPLPDDWRRPGCRCTVSRSGEAGSARAFECPLHGDVALEAWQTERRERSWQAELADSPSLAQRMRMEMQQRIPAWMAELAGLTFEECRALVAREQLSQQIAEKGAVAIYGSSSKSARRAVEAEEEALNVLAKSYAIAALHAPGGVEVCGLHFERRP